MLPSDKYEITVDGFIHTLKINNCNTQDESVYGFKLGKLSANARLNVESKCLSKDAFTSVHINTLIILTFDFSFSHQNSEEAKRCYFTTGCHSLL